MENEKACILDKLIEIGYDQSILKHIDIDEIACYIPIESFIEDNFDNYMNEEEYENQRIDKFREMEYKLLHPKLLSSVAILWPWTRLITAITIISVLLRITA